MRHAIGRVVTGHNGCTKSVTKYIIRWPNGHPFRFFVAERVSAIMYNIIESGRSISRMLIMMVYVSIYEWFFFFFWRFVQQKAFCPKRERMKKLMKSIKYLSLMYSVVYGSELHAKALVRNRLSTLFLYVGIEINVCSSDRASGCF